MSCDIEELPKKETIVRSRKDVDTVDTDEIVEVRAEMGILPPYTFIVRGRIQIHSLLHQDRLHN